MSGTGNETLLSAGAPHVGPRGVYQAIARITAAFARDGIAKSHRNADRDYDYRSIDDLQARLAPLLAKHGLVILPHVLRKTQHDRRAGTRSSITCVDLHVAFDFFSTRDGSKATAEVSAEAWDDEDKATAKAMTAAYKTAMFQTFCIPALQPDADETRFRMPPKTRVCEPQEGWAKWTEDKITFVLSLNSAQDVTEFIDREESSLQALSTERPDCYQLLCAALGELDSRVLGSTTHVNAETHQGTDVPAPDRGNNRAERRRMTAVELDNSAAPTHLAKELSSHE